MNISVLIPEKLAKEVQKYGTIIAALENWVAFKKSENSQLKSFEQGREYLPGFDPADNLSTRNRP